MNVITNSFRCYSFSSLEQAHVSQRCIQQGTTPGDPDSEQTRTRGSELIISKATGSEGLQHYIYASPLKSAQRVPFNI